MGEQVFSCCCDPTCSPTLPMLQMMTNGRRNIMSKSVICKHSEIIFSLTAFFSLWRDILNKSQIIGAQPLNVLEMIIEKSFFMSLPLVHNLVKVCFMKALPLRQDSGFFHNLVSIKYFVLCYLHSNRNCMMTLYHEKKSIPRSWLEFGNRGPSRSSTFCLPNANTSKVVCYCFPFFNKWNC